MSDLLKMGIGRYMLPVPATIWRRQVARGGVRLAASLRFMSEDHHRVRYFVVRELPARAAPIPPALIAGALDLPLERVNAILRDLEEHLTFIFRNERGEVAWAYPVTADATPHRVTFSTGERIYAAWAEDAIATPFVQGRLKGGRIFFSIATECAHCGQPIHIEMNDRLDCSVRESDANPLVFTPTVDFSRLTRPSIIDDFWRQCVFFRSEEHARDHREAMRHVRGNYWTLPQAVYMTPIIQGALFAFPPGERAWKARSFFACASDRRP